LSFAVSGWLAPQGSRLRRGHAACRPNRRVLRDGALTRQDARSTAIRSWAHRSSIAPSRAGGGSELRPARAGRDPSPRRNDLGEGRIPRQLVHGPCVESGTVLRGQRSRSWCAAVCSAPQLIKVAPGGEEMGGLRGRVPECGTECSLSGTRSGIWEQGPRAWTLDALCHPPRRGKRFRRPASWALSPGSLTDSTHRTLRKHGSRRATRISTAATSQLPRTHQPGQPTERAKVERPLTPWNRSSSAFSPVTPHRKDICDHHGTARAIGKHHAS
jgi:hypothetical protein